MEYLVFVPPLTQKPAVPKTSFKSGFLSIWVPRWGELRAVHHGIASLLLSRQAAGGCPRAPPCPFVEPGKGGSTPVPASSRHTSGCHKPQAGFLCFLPHEEESGECTLHTQTPPLPSQARPSQAPGRVPVFHHAAPPRVRLWPVGSAGTGSRSLVSAPRSVSVAPADHQTRLRDSVHPASPKFRGVHFTSVKSC